MEKETNANSPDARMARRQNVVEEVVVDLAELADTLEVAVVNLALNGPSLSGWESEQPIGAVANLDMEEMVRPSDQDATALYNLHRQILETISSLEAAVSGRRLWQDLSGCRRRRPGSHFRRTSLKSS